MRRTMMTGGILTGLGFLLGWVLATMGSGWQLAEALTGRDEHLARAIRADEAVLEAIEQSALAIRRDREVTAERLMGLEAQFMADFTPDFITAATSWWWQQVRTIALDLDPELAE